MKKTYEFFNQENIIFWKQELENMKGFHFEPDHFDFISQNKDFKMIENNFGETIVEEIKEFCRKNRCTPYHVILTAVICTLLESEHRKNINIWLAVANSFDVGILDNMSVISLPLCAKFQDKSIDFMMVLETVMRQTAHILDHQDVSLNEILDKSNNLIVQNIEEISNVFFDFTVEETEDIKADVEEIILDKVGNTKYDINFDCTMFKDRIIIQVSYDNNLFRETRIKMILKKIAEYIKRMLCGDELFYAKVQNIVAPSTKIGSHNTQIDLINEFLKNVNQKPFADAIVMGNNRLNYEHLYQRIRRIIAFFNGKGIEKGDYIAVISEKNIDSITCISALLFGGYTYIPISKEYPEDRVKEIIESCKVKGIIYDDFIVLCKEENLRFSIADIIHTDIYDQETGELSCRDNSEVAYIMYTSGSTGKPKGVKISWGNLLNYCSKDGLSSIVLSKSAFRILSVTNLEFDISITEIFLPFVHGGCCIITPKLLEDEKLFLKYVEQEGADIIQTTPTNLKRLMLFYKGNWMKYLKIVFVGGESFPKALYNDIRQKTDATIINVYGPTETTVWATYKIIEERPMYNLIGSCLNNYSIYIMQDDRKADIECVGEICIGGDSVAIGYMDEENRIKFKQIDGERCYFTGDMGRRLPSGEIEFIGRKDMQVKRGGYRIELEEIAEIAKEIYGVNNAIANIVSRDTENQICLYYIRDNKIEKKEIEEYLLKKLPKYMMPTYYVEMKEFPLTTSGKINLKRLPSPDMRKECLDVEINLDGEKIKILEIVKKVFARETISLEDNFWKIGGNSIKAVALVNAVERRYGIRIRLKDVLSSTNVKEIVDYINRFVEDNSVQKEKYHTTSTQKRMYALQKLNPDSTSYNMPILIRMHQYYDPIDLRKCIMSIILKFEILRMKFKIEENELWQIVFPYDELSIQIIRKDNLDPLEEMKSFVRPFSLENDALIRAEILLTNNEEFLLIDIHHIISDEVSNHNILSMLDAELSGKKIVFDEWGNFGEYSEYVQNRSFEKEEKAWKGILKDIKMERLTLPRSNSLSFPKMEGAKQGILLPIDTLKKIREISIDTNCSIYAVLLSFLFILLKKVCNQDMITVGCPISERNIGKYENTLGPFVNTAIIFNKVDDNKIIGTLIAEIQESILFAIENINYPFEKIVNLCDVGSAKGQNPIFDVLFNFYEDSKYGTFDLFDIEVNVPKVDLSFNVIENDTRLFLECEYNKAHYSSNQIYKFLQRYSQLLSLYLDNMSTEIGACDTCLPDEKEIILNKFNLPINFGKYKDKCLQDYLYAQAQTHPNDIAVIMDDKSISFKDLDMESSIFAEKLISNGIKKNEVIPLIIYRSIEMFIGIWGILKAGGAYLPIRPYEPDSRMKYIVNKSEANYIICEKDLFIRLKKIFPEFKIIVINRNELYVDKYETMGHRSDSDSLAYVIYTSGTTGNPKGVMVEHGSVINRIMWMIDEYAITSQDRILFKTPFCFDVSVWEIFIGVFCGATVYILHDGEEKEPEFINKAIIKHSISIIHFVPTMLNVFLDYIGMNKLNKDLLCLRYVVSSGETLKAESVEKFYNFLNETKLINLYGPTEATVDVTHYECTGKEKVVAIGKPIENINIYIMNGNTLTGIDIKGELCIAGVGVARGYINDRELSEKKFVENIFGYGKMYRTGDIACWDVSGNILFFGRKDRQVKIHGNRIELGEIEEKILAIRAVKDVLVCVDNSRLIAQVVKQNEEITSEDIKKKLELALPSYMIPNSIIFVPALRLSANGKAVEEIVNIESKNPREKDSYIPMDTVDKSIMEVMSKVLGHEINMHESFVKSGGDSILAIFAANQLQKNGIKILAKDIMSSETFIDMKKYIEKKKDILPQKKEKEFLFSPIINDFYEEWPIYNKNYFNQSCLLLFKYYNETRIISSIEKIIKNHDMLRAEFSKDGGVIKEYDDNIFNEVVKIVDVPDGNLLKELNNVINKTQQSLSLERNVLFRFIIIKSSNQYYLFICMHHLIIDAVSWGILLYELESVYQNQSALLPERSSFGEWTKRLNDYRKEVTVLEKNYWFNIVKMMQKELSYEKSYDLIREIYYSFDYIDLKLIDQKLKAKNLDVRSAILGLIARALSEKDTLCFDIENYGRGAIENIDLSGTVGWFTIMFPMIIRPQADMESIIYHIFDSFDSIPNDGIAYGLLKPEFRKQGYTNLHAQYCFNYLGRSKEYSCKSFVEIQERIEKDIAESNSMGHDIVFDVFEENDVLKMKMRYKSSKENVVKVLCERMNSLQTVFLNCFDL